MGVLLALGKWSLDYELFLILISSKQIPLGSWPATYSISTRHLAISPLLNAIVYVL